MSMKKSKNTKNTKKNLKPYRITLECMFEIGRDNMFSSMLNDVIFATDLIDAHSQAVALCNELKAVNTAYMYEVESVVYEGTL